ncbi:hypothetical protein PENTCL1PPCAC_5564 [Pristionchus entomophagus]|uniref:Bicarbonate transporter-like transmembrane domain-containing protein n=1 Tax=Pristionchus entomophagus TaxID=358040 RepID=A0AAV5SKE5_9BILA|nr:hypothetical protein PENTCL1PPCAC_5564 [Pristionchus entomophagus]
MTDSGDSTDLLPLSTNNSTTNSNPLAGPVGAAGSGGTTGASIYQSAVHNCAKSIIDRKLRKFASETSFATEGTGSDASEREVQSRGRAFTVKPVQLRNGGMGGTHRGGRRRHDSDASGSAGSEATVASGTATPVRHHAPRIRRPKSASNVEMNFSMTSATIHSLETNADDEIIGGMEIAPDRLAMRRQSNIYCFDDDSIHEFEDDDGQLSRRAPVRVIVTATDSVRRASREHASDANGAESAPGAVGGRYAKKPDPRTRVLNRRTSHTLLYVPEQRRTSTASGNSVASCPVVTVEDEGPQVGASAPPRKPSRADSASGAGTADEENGNGAASRAKMLSKRVSWLSMKSLQDSVEPLLGIKQKIRRSSGQGSPTTTNTTVTMGGGASQYGSVVQLNETDLDFDSDTPPLDTLSWSFADEYDNVTLMYAKHEKIPMKDFGSEIRATMDIDHLLNKAVLLLDLQETSLEEIFAKIIHEMDIQEPEFTSEQVRSVLFTQDAGNQFHILSRTVQSICTTGGGCGTFDYDQTWICALCMLNTVQHRHVAIARLSHPTNLGRTMQDLRFIIIVIAPSRAKGTKTALETTRTFATLFADMDIRQRLVMAQTVEQFRATLLSAAKELAVDQNQWRERKASIHLSQAKEQIFGPNRWYPFRGLQEELKRRSKQYISDFTDGIFGNRTIPKLFSTVVFLYFACLLPSIAFGVLNDDNTEGKINVKKIIFAQAIGGIFFSLFGGQPMIILLTTVPLAIYIKVIFKISTELGYDFYAMYACVGLFCSMFLVLYAATEMCSLMKMATRSAEEMFSLFMAIAFTVESLRAVARSFSRNYYCTASIPSNITSVYSNLTEAVAVCNNKRDTSILYVLLMLGTLWLGLFLYNFRKTPYLTRSRREWLADYALPASVMIMTFAGSYGFSSVEKDKFEMREDIPLFSIAPVLSLPWTGYFVCLLLGFSLSFLFFIDQNITSAIVNNSQNKLKKGSSQNLDLFVVAILNMFLSLSEFQLDSRWEIECVSSIMNVRETRLASLLAHIMILASAFWLLPYPLRWIPTSVLHGLFLYMALTSLNGNEMFERLLLLITEQQAYPPTHYIRKVPQRKVHLFTACQLLQLIILCAFGFSPYPFIEMVFPIVCFFFLPIRHTLVPRLIDYKYLDALDGRH